MSYVWPVHGPITSGFGTRTIVGLPTFHNGIDIGAADKSPVVATASGRVTTVGLIGVGGNTIVIDHGGGVTSLYCHLSEFNVKTGDNVGQGQVIGKSGGALGELGSGNSTGPHLHFEVREHGSPVNPINYLSGGGASISKASPADIAAAEAIKKNNPNFWFYLGSLFTIGDLNNVIDPTKKAVSTVYDSAKLTVKVGGFITDPKNWQRIGLGFLGAVIILIATLELLSKDGAIQTIAKVA